MATYSAEVLVSDDPEVLFCLDEDNPLFWPRDPGDNEWRNKVAGMMDASSYSFDMDQSGLPILGEDNVLLGFPSPLR